MTNEFGPDVSGDLFV